MFKPLNLSLRMLRLHQICDAVTGSLLFFMVLFSPWAFGTTQPWSIWLMNSAGYLAGLLLMIKLGIRGLTGYQPARWGQRTSAGQLLTRLLAVLTGVLITYCLVSVVNSRSLYHRASGTFEYYPNVAWLPHSYDRASSLLAFGNYLALALVFWSAWDWLRGKTAAEERFERSLLGDPHGSRTSLQPERLRRLLWLLTINGGLLGLEGIIQRSSGTAKLLFFQPTQENRLALAQFGPFAYRSNAAQYFNLLWPVSLALWWSLARAARRGLNKAEAFGIGSRHLVLVCVAIMAACPLMATSRVGALVGGVNVILAGLAIWSTPGREDRKLKLQLTGCLAVVLGFGLWMGWGDLAPRLEKQGMDESYGVRNQMYQTARPMADASPWFGTGPGTFEPLFQFFRPTTDEYWPAQLHNDWLETLITFGWVGSTLILAALGVVLLHWFLAPGIYARLQNMMLFWMALAGCLFYARYDFPFQIYSILMLFLVLCAALFAFSHER